MPTCFGSLRRPSEAPPLPALSRANHEIFTRGGCRHAAKLNPGTVDIAVLPPVSVENWTLRNLRERVEQIRTAYLDALAEWPAGE